LFTKSLLHVRLHVKINMKTHSAGGYNILSRSASPISAIAYPYYIQHIVNLPLMSHFGTSG
ncbi:hypothetical protein, partial [Nitrosospira sp. Nsp1]|uniref:hypothetical protein n=1 Tax=Nitrosospira sp. Nsp1 TaxID=136547 RepID=UPI0008831B85